MFTINVIFKTNRKQKKRIRITTGLDRCSRKKGLRLRVSSKKTDSSLSVFDIGFWFITMLFIIFNIKSIVYFIIELGLEAFNIWFIDDWN